MKENEVCENKEGEKIIDRNYFQMDCVSLAKKLIGDVIVRKDEKGNLMKAKIGEKKLKIAKNKKIKKI